MLGLVQVVSPHEASKGNPRERQGTVPGRGEGVWSVLVELEVGEDGGEGEEDED